MKSLFNHLFLLLIILIILILILILFKNLIFITNENFLNNKTIILLGDSILNNSKYVKNIESIPYLLNHSEYLLLNLAQDNANISNVYNQLNKIPLELNNSNTYIFLSIGGNDILNGFQLQTVIEKYNILIDSIIIRFTNIHLILLNLYFPFELDKKYRNEIIIWNNNIKKYKYYIDLASILNKPEDFVSIIEPSKTGSIKIYNSIINYVSK